MKALFVVVVAVLSLSLAKCRASDDVVLTAWPQGPHFYLGEPIVLSCGVKRNSSQVWTYNWFRHNLSEASTPSRAHRVRHHIYSISALTFEDSGTYWCRAENRGTNTTLLSNPVSISVTADSPPASMDVLPDSSQHLQGGNFSLHCSANGGETAGWTLRQLRSLQLEDRVSLERPDKFSFNNITGGLSGLYWCEAARGDRRSNAINIIVSDVILQTPARPVKEGQTVTLLCKTSTNFKVFINKDGVTFLDNITITVENVTKAHEGFYKCVNSANVESPESWLSVKGTSKDHLEKEKPFIATWVWPVCAIIIILLLIPVIFLLVRSLRHFAFSENE
ncbi:contactin-2-like isoform X2 [Silurus meridionalis]|uniref:contactin-2-like isoform X2 n=1 Tax=Silurus meridionalis TaxID=175797 RepID=UPI001EEB9322|nr:contactin-2-like isoform X2 [Silurus meridionalis]